MAPETPKKIPKTVEKARLALQGKDINADTIKETLNSKDLNNLANVFRQSMCEAAKKDYLALPSNDARREWLVGFILDPESCTCKGYNKNFAYTDDHTTAADQWLTEEQLASPVWLNSKVHAQAVIRELESRPH